MKARESSSSAAPRGKVWLVGAGPGSDELITLRGLEVLRDAEVVLYDALSHPELLAYCAPTAELRYVGKRGGTQSPSQTWITDQLLEFARAGKRVVRLKGGDPSLFARGAEEALALQAAGVAFEIVPGIPSPIAAAAYAGVPLTHRELSSSVTFITGSDREGKAWSPEAWNRLATATETLCVLMGMRNLRAITDALIAGGRSPSTPAAVVQWAAYPAQRTLVAPLSELAAAVERAGLSNPAVVIVGEVVSLRPQLAWYERQPLFGKRIAIPRPEHQATTTATAVRRRGAEPRIIPAIEIQDPPDLERLRQAAREVQDYAVCVFTSANGVERFFAEIFAQGRDARAFGRCKLAVIGPKTAQALKPFGLRPDWVAETFVGEALAERILAEAPTGRVLIPRALVAREELPQTLRAAGLTVDVVPAYQTVTAPPASQALLRSALEQRELDVILFTSSSMVDAVVQLLDSADRALLDTVTLACIGPITERTARAHGLRVDVSAPIYTVDGLLDALEAHFGPGL
jgi:uroporphyrinogen III methyltransferase / synthase